MKIAGSKFWGIIALALVSLVLVVAGSITWFTLQLTSAEFDFVTRLLRAHIGPILVMALILLVIGVSQLHPAGSQNYRKGNPDQHF